MDHFGQFPVRIQQHFAVTPEEQDALVNALVFFHDYFSPGETNLADWRDVAQDQRLGLYSSLANKLATSR
jgi:hypothetical protein